MKSRFAIATVTVLSLLSLALVGFLTHGLYDGKANAQRVKFPAKEQALGRLPANSPAASLSSDSSEWQLSAPTTDPYDNRPHRGLSVPSSHPIVVAIKDGPILSGDLVNLGAFEFTTIFGKVSIPVNTIVGMRMAEDPRQPATICLSNGDSLTGVLATDSVVINTAWGRATIMRERIISIVTTTDPVTWEQRDGRWRIAVAEPAKSEGLSMRDR